MSEEDIRNTIFAPSPELARHARIRSMEEYRRLYEESIADPERFWAREAEMITWITPYKKVWQPPTGNQDEFVGRWFVGGKLNVADNCTTRWAQRYPDATALIWVGELDTREHPENRIYTYRQLTEAVNKAANMFRSLGVRKGDRVCLWLPMIPELVIAMLACAKIGAVHSIVFGGFSADSVKDRIQDAQAKILVTVDETMRSGRPRPMKVNADEIIPQCPSIEKVIVVRRTGGQIPMNPIDAFWNDLFNPQPTECRSEVMDSEDPLFILYTSGTTGKPKGALHTCAGYLLYTMSTLKYVWDIDGLADLRGKSPDQRDIWYCTADIGWITGHSYITYGPLGFGTITMMYEGVPTWPDNDRFWDLIERYKVTHFYTAPTAIRSLMRFGTDLIERHNLSSLKMLGTVGEPINPAAWLWYYENIGKKRCPIVDTYWQTETGGYLMTPLACITPLKPGSCTFPFFGVKPVLLSEEGVPITEPNVNGYFCIERPWPGIMRTVYGQHERFVETYFTRFPGKYYTGDGATIDADGYTWIVGRLDDVIKVSGHRLGSAEIESAIVSHPDVAEAAVVPIPHEIKGQAIFAYVTLKAGVQKTPALKKAIIDHVATTHGAISRPEVIMFADALPKTRSGKIMRRILKAIATGGDIGNTTTLADETVVQMLIEAKRRLDAGEE